MIPMCSRGWQTNEWYENGFCRHPGFSGLKDRQNKGSQTAESRRLLTCRIFSRLTDHSLDVEIIYQVTFHLHLLQLVLIGPTLPIGICFYSIIVLIHSWLQYSTKFCTSKRTLTQRCLQLSIPSPFRLSSIVQIHTLIYPKESTLVSKNSDLNDTLKS